MTAIFAMWNKYGFALAGDSNASVGPGGKPDWVDPVEKVFKVDGHQIAFAASGDAAIDGVEVNELVREWQRQLIGERPTLEEYVEDFLLWFYKQELPIRYNSDDPEMLQTYLEELRDRTEFANVQNMARDEIVQIWYDEIAPKSVYLWEINVFGRNFSAFDANEELSEEERVITDFASDIQRKINESENQNSREYQFMEAAKKNAVEVFPFVFGVEYDDESEWQSSVLELYYLWIENTWLQIAGEMGSEAKFLFMGYGSTDWIPKAVVLHVFNSYCRIPQVGVFRITSPETAWYLSLAVDIATDQLIHGYNEGNFQEIDQVAQPHLKKGHAEEFLGDLRGVSRQKIHETLKKMERLTVERLEFLARSMVQLESLRSYLDQPLPGVGGDIQVVTMTKSKSTVKVYPEFS